MPDRFLVVAWVILGGASGCCLETISGTSFDTSSGGQSTSGGSGSSSSGTGRASSSGSSSSGSSSGGNSTEGTTGFTGPFMGSVAIVRLAPEAVPDGGVTMLHGRFLMASDWPACDPDTFIFDNGKVACCFQPAGPPPRTPSAGVLRVSLPLEDGGTSTEWLSPSTAGGYDNLIPGNGWFSGLGGSGADVSAFEVYQLGLEGPTPVLSPPLSELTSLPTSQEWNVPLAPSELEYYFRDTVVLEVDGVGSVICSTGDEGSLMPALWVPNGLLANLAGHQGTVTVTRDDYRGVVDAGAQLQLGFRVGVSVQSAIGGVSFTP